jgi:hypothetical protein
MALDHRPVADQMGVRTRSQRLVEIPGVVDVFVRDEDPPHVVRFNEGEDVLQPLRAICGGARVDDHGLVTEDDH